MKNTTRLCIAAGVATLAIAAGACSSGDTSSSDDTLLELRPTTTAIEAATTTVMPSTSTVDGAPQSIELAPVTIQESGISSVVPQGWIEGPEGVFTGEGVQLALFALPTWAAPSPAGLGLEFDETQEIKGRTWDFYIQQTPELTIGVAVTDVDRMSYVVQLAASPLLADRYFEAVGTPAVDEFEVDTSAIRSDGIAPASVTVDGRTVAYATGGSGDTTVVFDSGAGDGMASWLPVAPEVSSFAKIFAYDRPGYGNSDRNTEPADAVHTVENLRVALVESGQQPPYVLVGHSLGGMYLELFARTYPDDVAGLVLVDSSTVGQFERCTAALGSECDVPSEDEINQLPEPFRSEVAAFADSEDQLTAARPGSVPTVVIAARHTEGNESYDAFWVELKREQAAELGATFVVAEQSSHNIQDDQPDLVVDAIHDLIEGNEGG